MFSPARRLLSFLFAIFVVMVVFYHFHHAFFLALAQAREGMKTAQRLPPNARNDYKVDITAFAPQKAEPPLPDISRFTVDSVAALSPALAPGKVDIAPMAQYPALAALLKSGGGDLYRQRLSQFRTRPQAIVISEGHYDFTSLAQAVGALTPGDPAIRREGDAYTLRLPLFIAPKASLTISNRDLRQLRLSRERSVFIANAGDLFILRANLTGWSERSGAASAFDGPGSYRPFITSWSGSRLYVAGSAVSSLGYHKGEAYGLTYSSCRECLRANPALPPPTGAIVGSVFTDMYSGFHSREAEDVAIVRNTYANNISSGIFPQESSRRLIIAGNEVYGSRTGHGVILSHSVYDSRIFDNFSHDNRGSGILLDRAGTRNIVAGNTCARNGGDGITFIESSGSATWGNSVYRNGLSGLRVRDSENVSLDRDVVIDNAGPPVVIYTSAHGAHSYPSGAGAVIARAVIKASGHRAAFKLDGANSLALSDINILSGGLAFSDDIPGNGKEISAALADSRKQVVVNLRRSGGGL